MSGHWATRLRPVLRGGVPGEKGVRGREQGEGPCEKTWDWSEGDRKDNRLGKLNFFLWGLVDGSGWIKGEN